MQYGRSGSVGGSIPPLAHCRPIGLAIAFDTVSSEFGARAEFQFSQTFATILGFSARAQFCQKFARIMGFL